MRERLLRSGMISASVVSAWVVALVGACGGDASSPGGNMPPAASSGAPGDAQSSDFDSGVAGGMPGQGAPTNPDVAVGIPPGPPAPPRELIQGDDAPGPEPVAGVCPKGSQPTAGADCLIVEKRGAGAPRMCTCEYICGPSCDPGEVCALDEVTGATSCRCHGALEPDGKGCVWTGLLDNGEFDALEGWRLWTSGAKGAARAVIEGGRLELALDFRCSYAWAGTTARLPPRGMFAGGAALVFDYSVSGDLQDAEAVLRVSLDGLADTSLLPTSTITEHRCVTLADAPVLSSLVFELQAFGLCADALDYRLLVDNIRLEPDPNCP